MNLRDNARSSLREGMKCLLLAEKGDLEQYKFAILHVSHYFEVALKYVVSQMHPLLIYKKPFDKNLDKSVTITPQEALYIIRNGGDLHTQTEEKLEIEKSDFEVLNRFKELRNKIEHHEFSIDSKSILDDISFLLNLVDDLIVYVADDCLFDTLNEEEVSFYTYVCDDDFEFKFEWPCIDDKIVNNSHLGLLLLKRRCWHQAA